MGMKGKVQGYYWHVECIHGIPGEIRSDDGDEPERGTFIDRAITMEEARRLDEGERAVCHPCLYHKGRPEKVTDSELVVLSYELAGDLCDCGATYSGCEHKARRVLATRIWQDAGPMEGAKQMDKLVCGDCWYKDNNLPPDERKSTPNGVTCSSCGDPVTEVVVIKGKRNGEEGRVVAPDEIDEEDDPADYKIVVEWERITQRKEYYTYTLTDPDSDDLRYVRDGDFGEIAWDVAYENSDSENVEDYENLGFSDDGPSVVTFVVQKK